MILQALYDYYQRKVKDPDSKIAPLGWEWKEIPYIIVIDEQGRFRYLECTIEGKGKEKKTKAFLVTKGVSRTIAVVANRFWDHYGYVLAHPKVSKEKNEEKRKAEEEKLQADAEKRNLTFVQVVRDYALQYPENRAFQAVSLFYDQLEENKQAIIQDELWGELIKKLGTNLSFRILGEARSIVAEHENCLNSATVEKETKDDDVRNASICLITGQHGVIARTHSAIPMGREANAKLLSFQKDSGYDSYYKKQGENAPISAHAEKTYTTALKTLLKKGSENTFTLQNMTYVFWAQEKKEFEKSMFALFEDNPDSNVRSVKEFLAATFKGKAAAPDQSLFYILALEPITSGRICVRFWYMGSTEDCSVNIKQHFEDLRIIHSPHVNGELCYILKNILLSLTFEKEKDALKKLPSTLASSIIRSMIEGASYPITLQKLCLNQLKRDSYKSSKDKKSQKFVQKFTTRIAVLKAYLNRKLRFTPHNQEKPITMSLDLENTNQAYLCGRLFAYLERIQSTALESTNSTIGSSYYGAASTAPNSTIPRLLRLKTHHIAKIKKGTKPYLASYYDKKLDSIINKIRPCGFPRQLSLDDQSRFAIGYHHQREDLFTSKKEQQEED